MKPKKKYIIPIVIALNLILLFYLNLIENGEQLSNRLLSEFNENPYNPTDNRFVYIIKKIFKTLSQIIDTLT